MAVWWAVAACWAVAAWWVWPLHDDALQVCTCYTGLTLGFCEAPPDVLLLLGELEVLLLVLVLALVLVLVLGGAGADQLLGLEYSNNWLRRIEAP